MADLTGAIGPGSAKSPNADHVEDLEVKGAPAPEFTPAEQRRIM